MPFGNYFAALESMKIEDVPALAEAQKLWINKNMTAQGPCETTSMKRKIAFHEDIIE